MNKNSKRKVYKLEENITNMAISKTLIITIVSIVVLLLIAGGIYYFLKLGSVGGIDKISSTSDDGAVSMGATFYDFQGTAVTSGVQQALIGGTSKKSYVVFELKATNTGNVKLTNVKPTEANANIGATFNNIVPLANLDVGQSNVIVGSSSQTCTSDANCDTNEDCCNIGTGTCHTSGSCFIKLDTFASGTIQNNVIFSVKLTGNYLDAQGVLKNTTSSAVELTYNILLEKCSDLTNINTCVFNRTSLDSDKPKYCNFVEGSAPTIIDKASICSCPTGLDVSGENCVTAKCTDNTLVGACSTVTHEGTYGAYMFCNTSKVLVPDCNLCGATTDANGGTKISCNPPSGRPSSAIYTSYSGGLSGCIPDCVGKGTGVSDDCSGTCP